MKFTLQTRDRLALTLLAGALGLYFLVSAVVFPAYDGLAAAEASAIDKEDQLLRYRRALARASDYAALIEAARTRIQEGEARLIPGDNPSLASAQLQTLVEGVAERTGIELGQRNLSPARPTDDYFNEITMSLTFECTPGQLIRFLADLRNVEEMVVVRSIQVSPLEGADAVPVGELIKDLTVNVTVSAVLAAPTEADAGEFSDEDGL